MAEAKLPKNEPAASAAPPASPQSGGKIVMVGFISAIVIVETALFFVLMPSTEEYAALAEARLIRHVQQGEQVATDQEIEANKPQEFDLGTFGEIFSPIGSDNRYRVEFRLFGLVKKKDMKKMKAEVEVKSGRLRHAIRMKIRNSELSELEDNQLGLLQRRILATCNHLLEDDILLSVGFNDYQVFQE